MVNDYEIKLKGSKVGKVCRLIAQTLRQVNKD